MRFRFKATKIQKDQNYLNFGQNFGLLSQALTKLNEKAKAYLDSGTLAN